MHTIPDALDALRSGLPVLVADDEGRENEGDLIVAAEFATPDVINLFATEGRGLMCAALSPVRARELELSLVYDPQGPGALHDTAFTTSVDYRIGTTTGISAADRSATFQALGRPSAHPKDFSRPGHAFPLIAKEGGVLERRGHTEATLDLCRLAGLSGTGVLCEVLNSDGTMARFDDLERLSRRLGIPLVTVEALWQYRVLTEQPLREQSRAQIPTPWGDFELSLFTGPGSQSPLALHRGTQVRGTKPPLVRVHSECLTGDVFSSQRCDCGAQLEEAQKRIAQEPRGAVVYLHQEGRGIGLSAKLKAYELQQTGLDTVDANLALGFSADLRTYHEAAWILRSWGWTQVRLLTNNPAKVQGLEQAGITVVERVPLDVGTTDENRHYKETKRTRMQHEYSVKGEQA